MAGMPAGERGSLMKKDKSEFKVNPYKAGKNLFDPKWTGITIQQAEMKNSTSKSNEDIYKWLQRDSNPQPLKFVNEHSTIWPNWPNEWAELWVLICTVHFDWRWKSQSWTQVSFDKSVEDRKKLSARINNDTLIQTMHKYNPITHKRWHKKNTN